MYIVRTQVGGGRGSKEAQKLLTLSTMCTQGGGGRGSKKAKNLRTYYVHGPFVKKNIISYAMTSAQNNLISDFVFLLEKIN